MKYVSIDIETTGLDRELDQVLQLALVIEDTNKTSGVEVEDLPFFEGLVRYDRISGQAFALTMNAAIIEALAKVGTSSNEAALRGRRVKIYHNVESLIGSAIDFLDEHLECAGEPPLEKRDYVVAGKNVAGFDLPFLPVRFRRCFHHRVIDVGSVALGARGKLWKGNRIPGLADLHDGKMTHDALEDARVVVRLLRKLTNWYQGHYVPGSENDE